VSSTRLRILHVVTDLNGVGGSEVALYHLLRGMDREKFPSEVVVLKTKGPEGTIGDRIQKLGVAVHELGIVGRRFRSSDFLRLVRHIRRIRPDLVQTWLYHPNLVGGLAARLCGVSALVWNLRSSPPVRERSKPGRFWAFKAGGLLSRWLPDAVVSCSSVALDKHLSRGYRPKRTIVIPNGFEPDEFRPDASSSVRQELGIKPTALVIGMVARFHADKDHATFVTAAGELNRRSPNFLERHDVQFVLCGERIAWDNERLASWIEAQGLRERFHLLGRRTDPARVTAGFDIASLTSVTEAFPNVVGEAMACEIPCVVTDVGEAAAIIGEAGIVVPPGDAVGVSDGWRKLGEMGTVGRKQLGTTARDRIRTQFSLRRTIGDYEHLYRDLVPIPAAAQSSTFP
jgi:glycosyltransferase involved in cell wall biosynthesis